MNINPAHMFRRLVHGTGAKTSGEPQESAAAALLRDLGFRPPGPDEEAEALARQARGELAGPSAPSDDLLIAAAVVSRDPLISYSGIVRGTHLGVADLLGGRLQKRIGWFLISPTWSLESEDLAEELRARAVLHRRNNPRHRLVFVCNTWEETALMQSRREAAFHYNKTAHTPETIFRPLPDVLKEFDAIYNAQLALWKRHELTAEIERCAFLCYRDRLAPDSEGAQRAILERHRRISRHVFLNPFDEDNLPIRLRPAQVNLALNRARVGLCLSAVEGAMFASVEYLLAGLPIVTTPSKGGRDIYHDSEYCWTVAPDPRSVAEAVRALGAKGIPASHIRARTLRLLERDRERFLGLIDAILEASGSPRRLERPWPFRKLVTMSWMPAAEAADRAAYPLVDAFDIRPEKGLVPWRLRRKFMALQRRLADG